MLENISMKKVVHVAESFGGGVYSFLTQLCNEIVEDYEIVIVYSLREDTPKDFRKDFDPRIRFVKVDMCRGFNTYKNIKSLFLLRKVLKKENPYIIHLHSSKAGFLGRIASYLNKFNMNRVFYNPHGFAFLQQNFSDRKRKIFYGMEKVAARLGGNIVGCSKTEYKYSLNLTNRSFNVNNAINNKIIDNESRDILYTGENETKHNPIIGIVGRITHAKNPELFNDIATLFPELTFMWIGDGELKHLLTSPNIIVTGWLSKKELYKKLISIDIYIMTSLWEGLPISLLEAMYFEKPSIVSNVIGNKDVIKHYESGFIANNKSEFIKYINILLEDSDLKEKICKCAKKQIVEEFCIERMVDEYKKLYIEC